MATKGKISVQPSRFALLKLDDDSDVEEKTNGVQKDNQQNTKTSSKKRNKKKKKEQSQNQELRDLAFGHCPKKSGDSEGQRNGGGDNVPSEQWDEWKKADDQYTQEEYEQQLEQALLMSKVDYEEKEQVLAVIRKEDSATPAKDKKKKKKAKPGPMSLGEFNELVDQGSGNKSRTQSESHDSVKTPPAEADPAFFSKVSNDVSKIVHKEKVQEEYRKQYIVENARTKQFEDEISKRDKEIEELKDVNKTLEAEIKQVKKRNQQLCHILGQGEMKDKTVVLIELEDLKQVRDELTVEVSNLTQELEKERSKVHALKADADKAKGGKHTTR